MRAVAGFWIAVILVGCGRTTTERTPAPTDPWAQARERMVADTIEARGVADPRVLAAMRKVPRHEFVSEAMKSRAYSDSPLPIEHDQTISQPYIVALMTELAQVGPDDRVLEVGTGSGYQAAVLAEMTSKPIVSIEIVEPLATSARATLERLGYGSKVKVIAGDGYRGWPEAAPFDAILVTAAPEQVPAPLIEQLAVGGRLVIPVGDSGNQELRVLVRTKEGPEGIDEQTVLPVRFVPMTGEAQDEK
jgi:protein-L-isoaspartate(D-aspartate) O-methyltransferase